MDIGDTDKQNYSENKSQNVLNWIRDLTLISPAAPHINVYRYKCVVLIPVSYFCVFRPQVAVHKPGYPDLHRVLWHPPGDGRPHLSHPVHGAGQTRNLRTLGESF